MSVDGTVNIWKRIGTAAMYDTCRVCVMFLMLVEGRGNKGDESKQQSAFYAQLKPYVKAGQARFR